MAILLHGTTFDRATRIVRHGPDPNRCGPEGFSTYLETGPFLFGRPEEYACGHARIVRADASIEFTNEGGAVILAMDVPDEVIALALDPYLVLQQGLVQFNIGFGLLELIAIWSALWTDIRSVKCS